MSVTHKAVEQGAHESLGDVLMWVNPSDAIFAVSTVGLDDADEYLLDLDVQAFADQYDLVVEIRSKNVDSITYEIKNAGREVLLGPPQ